MAGILGMIAPPVNIPAMIIGGGIDMPYVGFEVPLLLLTMPVAIFSALFYGYRYARKMDRAAVLASLEARGYVKAGFAVYIPIILVVALMVADKALPEIINLGMPLTFVIGTAATLFVGKKFKLLDTAKAAMDQALDVLGILVGVGMFIQIMTLTGVRGFIVVNALSVPPLLLYAAIAITIPLFGAVSAFGASSVLGVPFLLALLQKDQIVTAASLSFIASLGDFMPPTALAAIFAAQVVGIDKYSRVLKRLWLPALIIIAWGLLFIEFSKQVRGIY
jgi:TRAP-type C4-dicarboxylate transport system permease large subunit